MFAVPNWFLALLLFPLIAVAIDSVAGVRACLRRVPTGEVIPVEDFAVLVPIWGDIRYLENVEYLAQYGQRVTLCTTATETPQFMAALHALADQHGFAIFVGHVERAVRRDGTRATSGPVRDALIRDAVNTVSAGYVVCLDADTVTVRPLSELVGAMVARDLDLASVRLVPSNTGRWLGRLQAHEYRMAMRMRLVVPWLVSGACHAARTEVHRAVMARHSLFFQGNDVELGVRADAMGYRVGHVVFEVPTSVPDRPRAWLRQRLAWAGGEFRLYAVNAHLARRHPFFWGYGLVVVLVGAPWRWLSLEHLPLSLAVAAVLYLLLMVTLAGRQRDRWLLLMPFYAGFTSLVLTPLGVIWYLRMAWVDRNAGLIRV